MGKVIKLSQLDTNKVYSFFDLVYKNHQDFAESVRDCNTTEVQLVVLQGDRVELKCEDLINRFNLESLWDDAKRNAWEGQEASLSNLTPELEQDLLETLICWLKKNSKTGFYAVENVEEILIEVD